MDQMLQRDMKPHPTATTPSHFQASLWRAHPAAGKQMDSRVRSAGREPSEVAGSTGYLRMMKNSNSTVIILRRGFIFEKHLEIEWSDWDGSWWGPRKAETGGEMPDLHFEAGDDDPMASQDHRIKENNF